MKVFLTLLAVAIVAHGCLGGRVSVTDTLKVDHLQCEYLANPMGIDVPQPRFNWKLESPMRGQKQAAYRVLVASSRDKLARNIGDRWDTGKLSSDQSIQIAYASMLKRRKQNKLAISYYARGLEGNPGDLEAALVPRIMVRRGQLLLVLARLILH